MSDALPFISIIVPVEHDDPGPLLTALEEQSYPPYRFEVLLCGETESPPGERPFSVRVIRDAGGSPAAARNRGAAEARGSLLAFTLAGTRPDPGWLEVVAQSLSHPEVASAHGPVRAEPALPPFFPGASGLMANMAVRREALTAVGGFDETFAVPSYEVEDLARRLAAGYGPLRFAEGMAVSEPPHARSFAAIWRAARAERYLAHMQRVHPDYMAPPTPFKTAACQVLLALLGSAPLLGAPVSFALAWVALFAWQATRLQRILQLAMAARRPIAPVSQLAYLFLGWLVAPVRLVSRVEGRRVRPAVHEEVDPLA